MRQTSSFYLQATGSEWREKRGPTLWAPWCQIVGEDWGSSLASIFLCSGTGFWCFGRYWKRRKCIDLSFVMDMKIVSYLFKIHSHKSQFLSLFGKPKIHTMYTVQISCLYTCTVCDGFGPLVCFRYAVQWQCARVSVQHRLLLTSWVWLCQTWILQITLYPVRWFYCKLDYF